MGVKVQARTGRLVYRCFLDGADWREGTGLRDTPKNRAKLEQRAATMSDLMAERRFDYLQWFPDGVRAAEFQPAPAPAVAEVQTVAVYATGTWQPRNQPPLVRASLALSRAKHLRCHILPAFGDRRLDTITPTDLEDFRALLTRPVDAGGKGLKLKTARDILDSTFRALLRDARTIDYTAVYGTAQPVAVDPFAVLRWKREESPDPDPFTEDERDALLASLWERRRPYHAFVYVLFHTGMRTGEAVGLRWGDVDLRARKLTIRRSRSYGEDNATKTKKSRRTIKVHPEVVAVLRATQPLHVRDDAFVFVSPAGCPLDGDRFVENHWHPTLRATGIRPRKLYATRHTFISAGLTRGANAKWLAGYCGTSLEMLEKHYGKWMGGDDDQLDMLRVTPAERGRKTA